MLLLLLLLSPLSLVPLNYYWGRWWWWRCSLCAHRDISTAKQEQRVRGHLGERRKEEKKKKYIEVTNKR